MINTILGKDTLLFFRTSYMLLVCWVLSYLVSCKSQYPPGYFSQSQFSTIQQSSLPPPDLTINSLDELLLIITDGNPVQNTIEAQRYQVNADGNLQIPILGTLPVQGKTIVQAQQQIHTLAQLYYTSPYVHLQRPTTYVTILGAVNQPRNIPITNNTIGLLQAIGAAGDITLYGKKENVLRIRHQGNDVQVTTLDLTKSDVLSSKDYYLQSGDVVYVEPHPTLIKSQDTSRYRNYTLVASGLSVLLVLLSRL